MEIKEKLEAANIDFKIEPVFPFYPGGKKK